MGWMDSVGGVLFGESGTERQETLDPQQQAARTRQLLALETGVNAGGAALGGYAGKAYNAYDESAGNEQFDRMKQFLTTDAQKQATGLAGSNMSRFSGGMRAGLNDIRDRYNKNMLGADQARLQAQTAGKQNAYSNQMNAIQAALTGNAQMLGNTGNLQQTQSTGLLDVLGGVAGGMGSVNKIMGGGTSTADYAKLMGAGSGAVV